MQKQASARASRQRLIGVASLFAATLLLAFALRYPSLYEPRWYGDEGIFAAIASNVRGGQMLYAEAWDNKPPLIFLTYAGVQAAFGAGVMPLHAAATAAVLLTQATVTGMALLLYGARRALVAALIFAFVMSTPVIEGNLALTETFMVLPASLAMLLVLLAGRWDARRRLPMYAAAGVMLGLAAAYKQVAVFDALAAATFVWFVERERLRALAPLAGGAAAVQLAFLVAFAVSDAGGAYLYAIVGSAGVYASLADTPVIVRFAGYVPALLFVATLVARRRNGGQVTARDLPLLWLGFAFAGAMSSGLAFPHYLQQAAPASALAAAGLSLRIERAPIARLTTAAAAVIVFALVASEFGPAIRERRQLDPVDYYRTFLSHRYGTQSDLDYEYSFDGRAVAVRDIASYIEDDGAGETLFTWSEMAWVYAAADVVNPTRYYASFFGEVIPGAKPEIIDDLEREPPDYVVIAEDSYAPFPELERFVEGRYALLRAQGDWRLYRRGDLHGRLTPIAPAPSVEATR